VGEETVRSHLKSLYQKLGVSGRSAAVAHAFRRGILSADSA
jgi:DNA-binding CsgD family transcriptional regulator